MEMKNENGTGNGKGREKIGFLLHNSEPMPPCPLPSP